MLTLATVTAGDLDQMVALRIEALRESLERLGRFDAVRARERLASGFLTLRHGFVQVGEGEFDLDSRWGEPHAVSA